MKISSCIHIVAKVKPPSCLYHATSLSLSEPLNLESVRKMLVAYVLVALSFCPAYLAPLWPSICLPPTVLLCGHFSAPRRTVGQHPGELWASTQENCGISCGALLSHSCSSYPLYL